jgi:hypothetical protein
MVRIANSALCLFLRIALFIVSCFKKFELDLLSETDEFCNTERSRFAGEVDYELCIMLKQWKVI